jgi:hypothetical protein
LSLKSCQPKLVEGLWKCVQSPNHCFISTKLNMTMIGTFEAAFLICIIAV